ncbi:hypothetical protein GJ496_001873 [Pomphorhynchus laevis]|nr:hypothetical protein GJ496_001873 [Pomphorhynchus laevis]
MFRSRCLFIKLPITKQQSRHLINYLMYCNRCDSVLHDNALFCHICGKRIDTVCDVMRESSSSAQRSERRTQNKCIRVHVGIVYDNSSSDHCPIRVIIPLSDGGGIRYVHLNEDDTFKETEQKIIDVYFPFDNNSDNSSQSAKQIVDCSEQKVRKRLKCRECYNSRILNFKLDPIDVNDYNSFQSYREKHGLHLGSPIFYLAIIENKGDQSIQNKEKRISLQEPNDLILDHHDTSDSEVISIDEQQYSRRLPASLINAFTISPTFPSPTPLSALSQQDATADVDDTLETLHISEPLHVDAPLPNINKVDKWAYKDIFTPAISKILKRSSDDIFNSLYTNFAVYTPQRRERWRERIRRDSNISDTEYRHKREHVRYNDPATTPRYNLRQPNHQHNYTTSTSNNSTINAIDLRRQTINVIPDSRRLQRRQHQRKKTPPQRKKKNLRPQSRQVARKRTCVGGSRHRTFHGLPVVKEAPAPQFTDEINIDKNRKNPFANEFPMPTNSPNVHIIESSDSLSS